MAKTTSKTKQTLHNRTRLEWALVVALLLIAFLFMASRYEWWPLNAAKDNLGTAFYTSRSVRAVDANGNAPVSPVGTSTTSASTASRTTGSTSTGSNGTSSTNDGGSGGGSSSTPLLTFATGVNVGNSKQQIDATVNGLNENCAVIVNLPLGLGKQEVCTYTQNGGTVTVTYLNDHVLSASLAGL